MALQVDEIKSTFSRFHQDSASLHRPMMLKDFLRDDSSHSRTPSLYGFPMYPCKSTALISSQSNKHSIVLLRSLSKKAAATKISAVHKVIKLLQFASLKSPSVLRRSFSRKLTRRSEDKNDIFGGAPEVKVKVKDILRWRSFRDTVEDNSTPLDFPSSPNRSTTDTSSCSKRSNWCDSDFTAEELPPWGGHENKEFWDNNSRDEWSLEEYEQQSPVSVLDSPFTQVVQDFISPSHPILSNIPRAKCNLTRRIKELNSEGKIIVSEELNAAQEKARKLLSHVKEDSKSNVHDHQVVLDFFMDELTINGKLHDDDDKFDCKILSIARSWMDGEFDESYEWEVEERRESYVWEMEKGRCWNKFKQEREQVSKELEIELFDDLVHDILTDFLAQ